MILRFTYAKKDKEKEKASNVNIERNVIFLLLQHLKITKYTQNFKKNQLTLYYFNDSFCKIVRVESFIINLSNKYFFIPENFSLA